MLFRKNLRQTRYLFRPQEPLTLSRVAVWPGEVVYSDRGDEGALSLSAAAGEPGFRFQADRRMLPGSRRVAEGVTETPSKLQDLPRHGNSATQGQWRAVPQLTAGVDARCFV